LKYSELTIELREWIKHYWDQQLLDDLEMGNWRFLNNTLEIRMYREFGKVNENTPNENAAQLQVEVYNVISDKSPRAYELNG
jgi:hypothetical protein